MSLVSNPNFQFLSSLAHQNLQVWWKMLHSIKLVPKASKFKAGKWWENAIRRCHYTCICGPSSREKRRSAQRASNLRKNQNLGQLINVSYHLKNRQRKHFFFHMKLLSPKIPAKVRQISVKSFWRVKSHLTIFFSIHKRISRLAKINIYWHLFSKKGLRNQHLRSFLSILYGIGFSIPTFCRGEKKTTWELSS